MEMDMRFARVAIAVDDARAAAETFGRLFGIEFRLEDEATKQVRVAKSDSGIILVQDISPDGKSSRVRKWWNGALCNVGFDVPLEQLEEAKEHLVAQGLEVGNYVEMETGFKDYSFEPVHGICLTLYAYPGGSWVGACHYEGDDPSVDEFYD